MPPRLADRIAGRLHRSMTVLPHVTRSFVMRCLPANVVGDARRAGFMRDQNYFDELYTRDPDPYGFDRNPVEQLKFARILDMCGSKPLGSVLELGCAVGTLTEMLAPHSGELLAVDISRPAVQSASERVARFAAARCEVWNLPDEFPPGEFDVIVASDILYYWTRPRVRLAIQQCETALRPGGLLVAAHYVPAWGGAAMTGEEAHDILLATSGLGHVLDERAEFGVGRPYKLDVLQKI